MKPSVILFGACGLIAGCMIIGPELPSGAALFSENCAACHGASGRGDGPAADGMNPPPADLTRISARNNGVFPRDQVMSRIDGYAAHSGSAMPEFGTYLEGNIVLDGRTPTPDWLISLADYLAGIQEEG